RGRQVLLRSVRWPQAAVMGCCAAVRCALRARQGVWEQDRETRGDDRMEAASRFELEYNGFADLSNYEISMTYAVFLPFGTE
ncbi:hypothetical protein, partial [Desulfatirhabdium butyrativorans]|uniref:hypothetical protein n=1 Tax=Desulfatirhabdium butyrativorans TaxID=340467 RepID=UPI001B7FB2B9